MFRALLDGDSSRLLSDGVKESDGSSSEFGTLVAKFERERPATRAGNAKAPCFAVRSLPVVSSPVKVRFITNLSRAGDGAAEGDNILLGGLGVFLWEGI